MPSDFVRVCVSPICFRYTPTRSEKPLTQFNEFQFKSKQPTPRQQHRGGRVPHKVAADTLPQAPGQHGMVLRDGGRSAYQPARTTPQPFNLSKSKKDTKASAKEKHVPLSKAVASYFNDGRSTAQTSSAPLKATQPTSPNLKTRLRAKPPATPSEQRQAAYVKQAARSFKAKPVSKAVLDSAGDLGVPRVAPPKATEPEPFQICNKPDPMETRRRLAEKAEAELKEKRKFEAKPVPHHAYGAGIPVVKPKSPTQQKPFELRGDELRAAALRELAEKQLQLELEREQATLFKAAKPLSAISHPYVAKSASHTRTLSANFI